MSRRKLTVVDDDSELTIFAGKAGSASFIYGSVSFVADFLAEAGREETADWLRDEAGGDVAWLTGIEVERGKRGAGVGSEILLRGLSELQARGVRLVFLHALADFGYEAKLDAWYSRLGFGLVGELDGLPTYYTHLSED